MTQTRRVPDGWTPADGHPDPRRDRFAKALAQGGSPSACYIAHMAKAGKAANKDSVKASAWQCAKEPPVAALILHYRELLNAKLEVDEETPITADELRGLMEEVSTILGEAHDVGEMSGVASENLLAKVRRALTVHVGRLTRATAPDKKASPAPVQALNLDAVPAWCRCD
tara:strand:+ start:1962 stop:2471 length:510 start_codon:yes stop_codon:yes gene_type:complete